MPELPEVENVVMTLKKHILNKQIESLTINNPIALKYNETNSFISRITNQEIISINRRGKYILIDLNPTDSAPYQTPQLMITHLAMTGALLYNDDTLNYQFSPNITNHEHLVFTLKSDNNAHLIFSDYRRFGSVKVIDKADIDNPYISHLNILQKLGVEPLDPNNVYQFIDTIRKPKYRYKEIKPILLNQEVIAGLGNIYVNEVLHALHINPYQLVQDLTNTQLSQIFHKSTEILTLSISLGGTSIKDYINGEGSKGSFQDHLKVYNQHQCKTCSKLVAKEQQDKRATYYCAHCQPLLP